MNTAEGKKSSFDFHAFFIKYNVYLILVAFMIVSALLSPDFLTWMNLGNLIKQNAAIVFMTEGMLFVLLTGGIDLSVGSMVAIGNVMCAYMLEKKGMGLGAAILVSILITLVLGAISGFLIAYAKMIPFVATLATQTIGRGFIMMVANGANIRISDKTLSNLSKVSLLAGTPFEQNIGQLTTALTLFIIILIILFAFIHKYTAFGRIMQAIGSNEEAVRLAGINVSRVKMLVYLICSLCCALSGIIILTRTLTGVPTTGQGWELNAIASNVLGGTSLAGGSGSVVKTLVGVFIFALISNIMNLLGIPSYPQDIVKGVIIVISVLLQRTRRR